MQGEDFFDPNRLTSLREMIAKSQLSAKINFGQHFILDRNLIRKIVASAGNLSKKTVIEVGPGPGGLTRGLLEVAERVIAIEQDSRCLNALSELSKVAGNRLRIIHGDATKVELSSVIGELGPAVIVSNLPYNVGTLILIKFLKELFLIESMTLMFQREVADRLIAQPGCKSYGRLSILSQWLCETKKLFDVPPSAFVPPPKITSSLVQFMPRPSPLHTANLKDLEAVTHAAFGQRRKMLRSSLKSVFPNPQKTLERLGLDPTHRAEDIGIYEFCLIASKAEQNRIARS
ncbi:MAG: 16S rRNA (adenine(1518)-N(6)/adenine(1519)-N(6))-dimethyltransferase RsmA [Rhodospirillaceae bacterium]